VIDYLLLFKNSVNEPEQLRALRELTEEQIEEFLATDREKPRQRELAAWELRRRELARSRRVEAKLDESVLTQKEAVCVLTRTDRQTRLLVILTILFGAGGILVGMLALLK